MKKHLLLIVSSLIIGFVSGQPPRKEFRVPDLNGFLTLKCDFHMHTVFSDGEVWPTARVAEAWEEGLDAIAITDHLEYNPKKEFIPVKHNAAFEIAIDNAEKAGIIIIHGTEITKSMPPGHFNAIFVTDATPIFNENYKLSIEEANKQGAFVMWNHPGWKRQAPDGPKWLDEHEQLYRNQSFRGIEVANSSEWYPEVLDWAIEKKLTILGNSEMHAISELYRKDKNLPHRTMTLVFVKEKSLKGIREALLAGRTAGYFNHTLLGKKELLNELFYKSILVSNPVFRSDNSVMVKLTNVTDIPFTLQAKGSKDTLVVKPGYSIMIAIQVAEGVAEAVSEYEVKNIFIGSGTNLPVQFKVRP